MSLPKPARLILILFVTLFSGATHAGGVAETTPPSASEENRTLRLLISGELGGLWEGKNPVRPLGGLGDADHGVIGALGKARVDKCTIPVLMGNNLGRAVKADSLTSNADFQPQLPTTLSRTIESLTEAVQPNDLPSRRQALAQAWLLNYASEHLDHRACFMAIQSAASELDFRRAELKCGLEIPYLKADLDFTACASFIDDANNDEEFRRAELKCGLEIPYLKADLDFTACASYIDKADNDGEFRRAELKCQLEIPHLKADLDFTACASYIDDANNDEEFRRAELKCGWQVQYQSAGLSIHGRCEDYLNGADTPEKEAEASHQCDRDLFIWQIERHFRAVAIGPGDFNELSPNRHKTLAELRHYPFVAGNIFVVSERQNTCEGEECNQQKPFLFAKEIFPTDPFVLELPNGDFSQIDYIELRESNRAHNPFLTRRILFQPGHSAKTSTFDHRYSLASQPSVSHVVRYASDGLAKVSDGKLQWRWPTPLWPNTDYELIVNWKGGTFSSCRVATHELFTVANQTPRQRVDQLRGRVASNEGIAFKDDRKPVLQSVPKTSRVRNIDCEGPGAITPECNPWYYQQIPIVDVSRMSGLVNTPVRILSVMDEKYQATLDRLPEDKGQPIPIVNLVRLMPMKTAVQYWRDLMDLVETPNAMAGMLDKLKNDPDHLGKAYSEFREIEKNQNATWSPNCPNSKQGCTNAWKMETEAWQCLRDFVSGRLAPTYCDRNAPLFDLRVESVKKTIQEFRESHLLVLLAHAEKPRVRELSDEFPDLALIVGQPSLDSEGPAQRQVVQSPSRPLMVQPEEFAATLDDVVLGLVKQSSWKVSQTTQFRQQVIGKPLELLSPTPKDAYHECCSEELKNLTQTIIVNEELKFSEGSSRDRDHLREWLKLRMRQLAKTETAYVEQGVVDPEVLAWIRALRRICHHQKVNVGTASVEELADLPGIDVALARKIKASGVANFNDLEAYWRKTVNDPDDAAWNWVRWFIKDGPKWAYISDGFVDQFFRRLAFVNYHLWKVVMTEDQLKTLEGEVEKIPGLEGQGLEKSEKKTRLHFTELGGKKPVTVALLSNLASAEGPFAVLKEETILRERILAKQQVVETGGAPPAPGRQEKKTSTITLQEMVRTIESEPPRDPGPTDWVELEVKEYDRQGVWTWSLNAAGLTYEQVGASQGFDATGVNDERTKTEPQRTVGVKPEMVFSFRGERLDWTNTVKSEFKSNRVGSAALPNTLADSWTLRSEFDFFLRDRGKINFPLYTAASFESQWRRPRQEVNLKDPDVPPLTFPLAKRKELIGEFGFAVTNEKKSKFFRFGFAFGADFNRVEMASVRHPNLNLAEISGTLSQIATQIGEMDVCPAPTDPNEPLPDPATETCFRPTTSLGLTLDQRTRFNYGFAFRGQYDLEFLELFGGQKVKFTTKLTDGNFFFTREGDPSSQPRFRLLFSNEAKFPLFGNFSIVPGFEVFVFQNKGSDSADPKERRQTYWSAKPFFRLDYTFDLKPAFMRLLDGLRFRNQ